MAAVACLAAAAECLACLAAAPACRECPAIHLPRHPCPACPVSRASPAKIGRRQRFRRFGFEVRQRRRVRQRFNRRSRRWRADFRGAAPGRRKEPRRFARRFRQDAEERTGAGRQRTRCARHAPKAKAKAASPVDGGDPAAAAPARRWWPARSGDLKSEGRCSEVRQQQQRRSGCRARAARARALAAAAAAAKQRSRQRRRHRRQASAQGRRRGNRSGAQGTALEGIQRLQEVGELIRPEDRRGDAMRSQTTCSGGTGNPDVARGLRHLRDQADPEDRGQAGHGAHPAGRTARRRHSRVRPGHSQEPRRRRRSARQEAHLSRPAQGRGALHADAAARDARRDRAVGRGARHPEQRGFRRRHRHRQGGRFERRLHGRRHQRHRCRGPRVDQGQALQQPGRSRRVQDHRRAQGARSVPERLLGNRQRPRRRARQALGARSREHPQGRQPQVRRRISRPMPCRA